MTDKLIDGPEDDPNVQGDAGEPVFRQGVKARVNEWKAEILRPAGPAAPIRTTPITAVDRFVASPVYAGIRRGAQVAIHLAGWTLANAAVLIAAGKPIETALVSGAAAAGGAAMITLSAEKTIKEKRVAAGEAPALIWLDVLTFLISWLLKWIQGRKK